MFHREKGYALQKSVPIYETTKEVKASEVLKAVNSKLESQKKLYGDMKKVLNDMMVKVKEISE